jgi:four helix bundle protein
MEKSKKYSDLLVWKKSHNLVIEIYRITKQLPKDELFGLTSQIRRSAISIPANIAEGFGRDGTKDKLRFYNIATGSLNEVDYYLLLLQDLGYAKTDDLTDKIDEIGRILKSYIKTIKVNLKK